MTISLSNQIYCMKNVGGVAVASWSYTGAGIQSLPYGMTFICPTNNRNDLNQSYVPFKQTFANNRDQITFIHNINANVPYANNLGLQYEPGNTTFSFPGVDWLAYDTSTTKTGVFAFDGVSSNKAYNAASMGGIYLFAGHDNSPPTPTTYATITANNTFTTVGNVYTLSTAANVSAIGRYLNFDIACSTTSSPSNIDSNASMHGSGSSIPVGPVLAPFISKTFTASSILKYIILGYNNADLGVQAEVCIQVENLPYRTSWYDSDFYGGTRAPAQILLSMANRSTFTYRIDFVAACDSTFHNSFYVIQDSQFAPNYNYIGLLNGKFTSSFNNQTLSGSTNISWVAGDVLSFNLTVNGATGKTVRCIIRKNSSLLSDETTTHSSIFSFGFGTQVGSQALPSYIPTNGITYLSWGVV